MNEHSNTKGWSQLTAGLVLLVLGGALLLARLDVVRVSDVRHLWPLIVIAFGVSRLFSDRHRQRHALTFIFIGCWLLINTLGLFGLDWGVSWPLVLVAVGLGRVLGCTTTAGRAQGVFLILLGAIFQAMTLGYLGLDFDLTWPLVLVAIGLWIILRAFLDGHSGSGKESDLEQG
jgi:LiaF transmembrane domain/LiaI-LiaF-like transmembrane region